MHPLEQQLQLHLQVCSSDFLLRLFTFSFFFCLLCCYSFGLATGATNAPTEPVTIAPTGMFFTKGSMKLSTFSVSFAHFVAILLV